MNGSYISPVKINLTLRVLSRRPDGYHEIISLFWKKKGIEGLTIQPHGNENIGDILDVRGMEISGENILFRALKWARSRSPIIPPLRMCLTKEFPAGSGIGAGGCRHVRTRAQLHAERIRDVFLTAEETGGDEKQCAGKRLLAALARNHFHASGLLVL